LGTNSQKGHLLTVALFYEIGIKPPGFKKIKKYKSFTLKQAGYKFLGGNRVKIVSRVYQFWNSRPIEGIVKTLALHSCGMLSANNQRKFSYDLS